MRAALNANVLSVSLLALCCLGSTPLLEAEEFTVFAPNQDPASIKALAAMLNPKEPELVRVAKTPQEALNARAGVLVLFLDRFADSQFETNTLPTLKKLKIIGIGYGAAQLFGSLGLEIKGGACAHASEDTPIEIKVNALLIEPPNGTLTAFQTRGGDKETGNLHADHNFAMHLPPESKATKVVEVIARWHGDENYAPIVRQGDFLMIGLAAPATRWTTEYKAFFSDLANRFAKAPRKP